MQTVDVNKDRVSGIDYGTGAPFEMTVREFMDTNPDDFEDPEFEDAFIWALTTSGVFQYPASMEDVPVYLVKGGA